MPVKDIKSVMDAHVNDLMSIPGVIGVALGELDDHTPSIMVLVEEATKALKKQIPPRIEGHPVVIEVTGKIRGMRDGVGEKKDDDDDDDDG